MDLVADVNFCATKEAIRAVRRHMYSLVLSWLSGLSILICNGGKN